MGRIAIAILLLLLPVPLSAQVPSLSEAAGRYSLLAADSRLAFNVPAVRGLGIQGRFERFGGSLEIPAGGVERARVTITIYPDSVATGQNRVDDFLKSNAVFDIANEREIVFQSRRVKRTGEDTAVIEGNLTARGGTFPETFQVRLVEFDGDGIRFNVKGKVYRSRYGMDVGTPIYSNIVDFDMDLVARRR